MRQWISFHSLVKDRYILTRDNQVGKGQQGENLQLEFKNKQPKLVTYRFWVKSSWLSTNDYSRVIPLYRAKQQHKVV